MSSIFAVLVHCYSLLICLKLDSTVICVPCMLEHVCLFAIFFKKLHIRKISYVNWLNFEYCLKFTRLRPDLSK